MKSYAFNFDCKPFPALLEENVHKDTYVNVSFVYDIITHFIYYIDSTCNMNKEIIQINEPTTFLLISCGNPAHSISEIISFINYYKKTECNSVCISEYVPKYLPLLFQFILLFIPKEKIIILYEKNVYRFTHLITHRNHHFNAYRNWSNIDFIKKDKLLEFNNIQYIKNTLQDDTLFLFDKVEEIYRHYKHKFQLYDNIMLIKTKRDKLSSSFHRAMELVPEPIQKKLIDNNIKYLNINEIKNIIEYICLFYHAKNIIVSYGGPCCTNRFFCNPHANVIVLAHLHYRYEYEYENENQQYWHVRHSHLCPVKRQIFLLDFDNGIHENNVDIILSHLK